jgi:hypothetical protein
MASDALPKRGRPASAGDQVAAPSVLRKSFASLTAFAGHVDDPAVTGPVATSAIP